MANEPDPEPAYIPYPILAPLSSFRTRAEQDRHLRVEEGFYSCRSYLRPDILTKYMDGLAHLLETQTEARGWDSAGVAAMVRALRARTEAALKSEDLGARQELRDGLSDMYDSLE